MIRLFDAFAFSLEESKKKCISNKAESRARILDLQKRQPKRKRERDRERKKSTKRILWPTHNLLLNELNYYMLKIICHGCSLLNKKEEKGKK